MHVVYMQQGLFRQFHIHAQAAALLPAKNADVVIFRPGHWETAEHKVAVYSALQFTGVSHAIFEAQFARDEMRLIIFIIATLDAMDLLQRHNVGVNLFQDADDSSGTESAVKPNTFMHVVSNDSKLAGFFH